MAKKKKKDEFSKKTFKSVDEAIKFLEKKQSQKEIKASAKAILGTRRVPLGPQFEQQRRAGLRRRSLGFLAGKAESLEIEAVSLNEIPLLQDMEQQRTRKTMIQNKSLTDLEASVTDSFPQ